MTPQAPAPAPDARHPWSDAFRALTDSVPVLLWIADADGRYVYLNERWSEFTGRPPERDLGDGWRERVHPDDIGRFLVAFRRALRTGTGFDAEYRLRAADGSYRWMLDRGVPRGDGGMVGACVDITDRARAERDIALLARAGEALDGSPGVEERLMRLASLLVPTVADFCTIDILDESGMPRLAASAHVDAHGAEQLAALGRNRGIRADAPFGVADVLRTGQARMLTDIEPDAMAAYARNDAARDAIRRLAPRTALLAPLHAPSGMLGVLCLAMSTSGRGYDARALELARQLGRRAGLAVDNARLYDQQHSIALTLQRSLLPPAMPSVPGMELAARYIPMGAGHEVGGDFYDVFEAGGSWAVVIGDVCGKGAEAAALTSSLRHTMRTLARDDPPPSAVLTELNSALITERGAGTRFSTAAYARVVHRASGLAVTVASAGHPLPLLIRAGGAVATLGRPGTLLGSFAEVRVQDVTAELQPGDSLLLFTDGITEARTAGYLFGEQRLSEIAADLADTSAEELAAGVERAVTAFNDGPLRDDLALVVLRAPEPATITA